MYAPKMDETDSFTNPHCDQFEVPGGYPAYGPFSALSVPERGVYYFINCILFARFGHLDNSS